MSKSASRLSATTCVLVLLTSLRLLVQGPAQGTDVTLDTATRVEVIEGTLKALNDFYVFPDVAAKMARSVRDRRQRHEYDSISSSQTLAEVLTTHLQEVSHDKHLRVGYSATVLPPMDARPSPDEIERQQQQARAVMSQVNFGFERVERLAGNIGYLDLRGFMPPQ